MKKLLTGLALIAVTGCGAISSQGNYSWMNSVALQEVTEHDCLMIKSPKLVLKYIRNNSQNDVSKSINGEWSEKYHIKTKLYGYDVDLFLSSYHNPQYDILMNKDRLLIRGTDIQGENFSLEFMKVNSNVHILKTAQVAGMPLADDVTDRIKVVKISQQIVSDLEDSLRN